MRAGITLVFTLSLVGPFAPGFSAEPDPPCLERSGGLGAAARAGSLSPSERADTKHEAAAAVAEGRSRLRDRVARRDLSRVVVARHVLAHDGSSGRDNAHLDPATVEAMVDEAVMAFTGEDSLVSAWQQVIPDPTGKVAIKVNCQITGIYTKSAVVNAIIDGLVERGVAEDDIIIYDRTENAFGVAGFVRNPLGPGVRVGVLGYGDLGGYSAHAELFEIAKLLIDESGDFDCDYLINVPVCKALDGYSGVTLSMKNHYGTCSPRHEDIHNEICRTNALPAIRDKTRLIVLDALYCQYIWSGGADQTHVDVVNSVVVGTDPVAVDYHGWQLIAQLRAAHSVPPVSPYPHFIDYAAEVYGLGTNDPAQMELIELDLHPPEIFADGFEDGSTSAWITGDRGAGDAEAGVAPFSPTLL